MRRSVRVVGALLIALLLTPLAPIAASAQTTDEAATTEGAADSHQAAAEITWGPCENPTLVFFGAECGLLSVPLDHRHPGGEQIQIAVSRVRATVPDEEYQGIMLVNPGGPGGSGLIFSVLGAFVPGGVGASYDWIGFDPRGVGDSVPALRCIPDYFAGPRPDYEPNDDDARRSRHRITPNEEAWLERSAGYAEACAANGGELLNHLRTVDTVDDMNAIRVALGEEQINFYGFSYGTYLAQVFATRYPEQVRRMVLDSNVDPRNVWYKANINQNLAFEVVFERFFEWVARFDDVYGLGSSAQEVRDTFFGAQDQLRDQPAGSLGPAEWADAFLPAGYLQELWPDVASAFAAFVNDGETAPAIELYEGFNDVTDDNGYAMYLATECTDARWPGRYSQWQRDARRVAARAPVLTWGNTWFNAPCLDWEARSSRAPIVRDRGIPPILLVSETLDAATPYSGSLEVRRRFRSSVLIATEDGTTHANSLLGGNACVDDRIADYLRDGTLPERGRGRGADLVCPALPEPEPATAGAAASGAGTAALAELQQALVGLG